MLNTHFSSADTIAALCTPQGSGALGLIRVSGPRSWHIVETIARLRSGKRLNDVESHTVHAAEIYDLERIIDSVMIIALRGPRTFTGYDTIEITIHHNPLIIQDILERLIGCGARPAQQGEFTRQAYDNKKIDLVQAEAINELIMAQTEAALKKSLSQLQGSLSSALQEIEDLLSKTIAWCESSFEFLDDEGDFFEQITLFLEALSNKIQAMLKGYESQKQIRQGYRVALIGSVNAGKSSLFNLIINKKRAIVTPVAGTTRDSIESSTIINGMTITFIDTAGLRTSTDMIEQEGIERSYNEAGASDIILLIVDGSREVSQDDEERYLTIMKNYGNKSIYIQNKSDTLAVDNIFFKKKGIIPLTVSAFSPYDKERIEQAILKKIVELGTTHDLPFLLNQRHYELLYSLLYDINHVIMMLNDGGISPHYELISYHLKQALERLSMVTGKTIDEIALDRVFKEFCVGK